MRAFDLTYVALIVAVLALVLMFWRWQLRRGDEILRNWAAASGYRIVDQEYKPFFTGPFFWTTAKGQMVYRVLVDDMKGHTRSGWVRCGSWLWGVWSDQADVRWDDEQLQ